MEKYQIALVQVWTPKEVCLKRVAKRNAKSPRPLELSNAANFYNYWTMEAAPTYSFALEVDETDERAAVDAIKLLKQSYAFNKE